MTFGYGAYNCLMVASGVLGLFLNSLLIYLIVQKSTPDIRVYKWFLLIAAVLDMCAIVPWALLAPVPWFHDGVLG